MSNDDDAANRLTLPVPLRHAATHLRPDADARHVPKQDRRAARVHAQGNLPDVVQGLDIAEPADHELLFRHLEQAPADIAVAVLHGGANLRDGNAVGAKPVRIHRDLVLPHETADARDFGDAGNARQRVLQEPVLDRTQFAEVMAVGLEGVHERPTHARGVGSEGWRDPRRQLPGNIVQVFEDAASRPVQVGAVFEDDVYERKAEKRISPNDLRERRRKQLRRQGVRHLVFDDARRLARILRVDDDLDIGQVGDGVERCAGQRIDAGRHDEQRCERDEKPVLDRPVDDTFKHRYTRSRRWR